MELTKAKDILNSDLTYTYPARFTELQTASTIGAHAISRLLKMRSYNIGMAIMPLPGENPIPDLSPSADRKQRLRESPLGKEPKG